MRKATPLLFGFLALLGTVSSSHAQTFKTADGIGCATGSSCATTTGIAVAANDTVVVIVRHGTTITCPQSDTLADAAGKFSFSSASVCVPNSNEGTMEAFVAVSSGTSASDTFTATFPGSRGSPVMVVVSYTGVNPTTPLDQTAMTATTGGVTLTVPSSGSITTTQANEVVIECGSGDSASTSWSAGSIGGTTGTIRKNQLGSGVNLATACQDLTVTLVQSAITATMTANSVSVDAFGLAITLFSSAPAITPTTPSVNQGATRQFSCSVNCTGGGTWSCSGTDASGNPTTCAGSINASTGLYTAPSSVSAQQTFGGYQLLPNNHIFNTRIDSLPADTTHGSTFTVGANNAVRSGCPGACSVQITITSATPPQWFVGESIVIAGIADNTFNGTFPIATVPGTCSGLCFTYTQGALSNATSGSGTAFVSWIAGTGLGQLNYLESYPSNFVDNTTPTGAMTFTSTSANNGTFQFPQFPYAMHEGGWFADFNSNTDRHIFSVDVTNGMMQEMYNVVAMPGNAISGVRYANSSYGLFTTGGTGASAINAEPTLLHPKEIVQAVANAGTIKHAVKMTLNQGYCASSFVWPASNFASDGGTVPFGVRFRLKSSFDISTFSATAKVLLTQLKQYGMILEDGGTGWNVATDEINMPGSIHLAFTEIATAAIVGSANFEAVDESGLQVSASSGMTTANREIVTFTRTSDSATVSTDISLQGPAVDVPVDPVNIQVGTPSQQLTAYNNFGGVTWSMSPNVGTLSSSGLYTPPASVASPTSTTVTVTSTINGAVYVSFTLNVFPSGTIRVIPSTNSNYTDSSGNIWYDTQVSNSFQTHGCGGGGFPAITDVTLWNCFDGRGNGHDLQYQFLVPNGVYELTYRYGTINTIGTAQNVLWAQNQIVFPGGKSSAFSSVNIGGDQAAIAGGQYQFFSQAIHNVAVINNKLLFTSGSVNSQGAFLSSLSIIPGGTAPGVAGHLP